MRNLVMVVSLVLTVLGAGVATAADDPYYVALGDSRATGVTWTSVLFGDHCGRTADAYPPKVAAALGVSYRSVACVAATTTDVLEGQRVLLVNSVPPQVDALSERTRLVTLSIGGNDIGWSSLISPCFPLIGDGRCRTDSAMQARITSALTDLSPKLDRVLAEIHRRSPAARIVVVGHGGYFGAQRCFPDARMSEADAPTVAAFFADFNRTLAEAAERAAADYVDIAGPAVGHDTCAGSARWFLGDWPRGDTQTRHPTPLGATNMARLVVDQLAS
ncbi:SGNH/GDSL hydrolase family protein [Gordonia sp. PKS22-38]|uniref:SGNH/GDSL hydrolase family protein n=1 Tax=Gordonia prachuapensis TaxID=3115651 RepID=A0ABU7MWT2_9ACTN|nr:SGNH/GDSL hydrolase family protein [Gordonia sp. PKS22-38]